MKEYFTRPSAANSADEEVASSSKSAAAAAAAAPVGGREQLVYQLNKSGRYLELKESLKQAVLQIIAEKYKAEDLQRNNQVGPGPDFALTRHPVVRKIEHSDSHVALFICIPNLAYP